MPANPTVLTFAVQADFPWTRKPNLPVTYLLIARDGVTILGIFATPGSMALFSHLTARGTHFYETLSDLGENILCASIPMAVMFFSVLRFPLFSTMHTVVHNKKLSRRRDTARQLRVPF